MSITFEELYKEPEEETEIHAFPIVGDYISAEDETGNVSHPNFTAQEINWFISSVLAVDGKKYQMAYDDSWYEFNDFVYMGPATGEDSNPGASLFKAVS